MTDVLKLLLLAGIELISMIIKYIDSAIVSFSNITVTNNVLKVINNVTTLFAMTLVVVFFMLEFIMKVTTSEDWITLPNLCLFFIRGVAFKSIVASTGAIMDTIYIMGNNLFNSISSVTLNLKADDYGLSVMRDNIIALDKGNFTIFKQLFYAIVIIIVLGTIFHSISSLIVSLISITIEIHLYKAIAPLPISTLVSSQYSIGIRFLQSYASACLQMTILHVVVILMGDIIPTIVSADVFAMTGTQIIGFATAMYCLSVILKSSESFAKTVVGL